MMDFEGFQLAEETVWETPGRESVKRKSWACLENKNSLLVYVVHVREIMGVAECLITRFTLNLESNGK